MNKQYRKQENRIIITGVILAAAVVVLCVFGYGYLNRYLADLEKKNNKVTDVELSEEMRYELIHTNTTTPAVSVATPVPEETPAATYQVTVLPETQHDMSLTPTMDPDEYWAAQATATPYVPAAEITAQMSSSFEAESSGYSVLEVANATASSVLSQQGYNNSASMAFDGDPTTSWQEGMPGYGEGEVLKAYFSETVGIAYITFRVGNWRNYELWEENTRPQRMTAWIGNSGYEVTFTDSMTEFCLAFSGEIAASEVTFEINEVYKGSSTDSSDLCISEITFYGSR